MEIRFLTWLFPRLMASIEFVLRASLHNADAVGFFGPTVGGAALGMMLPLTSARALSKAETMETFGRDDFLAFDARDMWWAQATRIVLWIGLVLWAASLYLSIDGGATYFPHLDGERTSIFIGFILWLAAVILDGVRGGE